MFYVGKAAYLVRISDKPIIVKRKRLDGMCDPDRREILISPTVPLERRWNVLLHELCHAFELAFSTPKGSEQLADFVASVAERACHDMTAAGGLQALMHLAPGERFGMETAKIGLTQHRQCPLCGSTIAAGTVLCRPDPFTPGQLDLALFCEHCGATARWKEVSACGQPAGVRVGTVRTSRGIIPELAELMREAMGHEGGEHYYP